MPWVSRLLRGDRVWIKADLPATQSAHYLLIAAFLSGSTNPPPANWFYLCETWAKPCAQDGLTGSAPYRRMRNRCCCSWRPKRAVTFGPW